MSYQHNNINPGPGSSQQQPPAATGGNDGTNNPFPPMPFPGGHTYGYGYGLATSPSPGSPVTAGWSPTSQSPVSSTLATSSSQLGHAPRDFSVNQIPSTMEGMAAHIARLEAENRTHQQTIQLLQHQFEMIGVSPSVMQSLPSFTFHRPPDQGERTTIRTRLVEKLNKNGNRCCAWHETRQEVHAYGPREAPEGIMTCGCTVEQALFEEALAKNSVGALETGRKRLDPALRNALLELLKRSYDYRDGDLAFDRRTLSWRSGETPAEWSQKVKFYQ